MRNLLQTGALAASLLASAACPGPASAQYAGDSYSDRQAGERDGGENDGGGDDRKYLVEVLTRIARPVLEATSRGELHERLTIHEWEEKRAAWTHYEAFARTMAGIAPWLELGPDDTSEGKLRAEFIELARRSLINATDPASPDYMNFGQVPDQPLVESAYLASALLAAPTQSGR